MEITYDLPKLGYSLTTFKSIPAQVSLFSISVLAGIPVVFTIPILAQVPVITISVLTQDSYKKQKTKTLCLRM